MVADLLLVPIGILMLVGLLGAFIPMIPAAGTVWFAAMLYAFLTNFREIQPLTVAILTLLLLITMTSPLWLPLIGLRATGGSFRGFLGGMLGMMIGTTVFFAFFPLSTIGGLIVGTVALEATRARNTEELVKITGGAVSAFVIGFVVEFVAALLMIFVFAVTLFSTP